MTNRSHICLIGRWLGERGYAVLFFANYMNDVPDVAICFRGVTAPDQSGRLPGGIPPVADRNRKKTRALKLQEITLSRAFVREQVVLTSSLPASP